MTLSLIAQSALCLLCLAALVWHRPLAAFMDDCSDGNVDRIERMEMARAWLAVMNDRRVG